MNKLLIHMINAGSVDHRALPGLKLPKAQVGKQVKTVIVDGKKMNTNSDEYEQAYKKGIGQWVAYDQANKQWKPLPNNLPNSAYKNAEFVSSTRELPEVTVTTKVNPIVAEARNLAKRQLGTYDDYVKEQQATVPKWANAMGFNNKEADKKIYDENYNNILNVKQYQNLIDAIPQNENESRIDYINRFNRIAGKNTVERARAAGVSEPFEPSNLNKLGQWGWKGLNHIGAGTEALFTSNPTDFMSTIQRGIDRGNQPISGMLPSEAKEVGVFQPFETVDNLAYNHLLKPALIAGDNLVDPDNKRARENNSRYLAPSETDKIFTSLFNPINYISGSELINGGKNLAKVSNIGEGLETAGKFLKESVPFKTIPLTPVEQNLKDLQYAKKVYEPLGYKIPENLERIAQSKTLTDRTIRGLVDRDHSFYRGVNVDFPALQQRLLNKNRIVNSLTKVPPEDAVNKFDALIGELKKANVDINNDEEVAKYMATHIPGETGAGRASLDDDVFKRGWNGLYTSNSKGTAEGYTYGKGYIVKVKKPTDFSSSSRRAWIDRNNPQIQTGNDYKLPFLSSKPITFKTDYERLDPYTIAAYKEKLGFEKLASEYPELLDESKHAWQSSVPEMQQIHDRRNQLRRIADEELEMASEPYQNKLFNIHDRRERFKMKNDMNNVSMPIRMLKGFTNPRFVRDILMEPYYDYRLTKLKNINSAAWRDASVTPWVEKYPELANAIPEIDPYAHYIHIGKVGEKVLEPVSAKRISPEMWKYKSRGHSGEYSRQATRREFGGEPCYECGGMYAYGGDYDCLDQEKDPVTGKCSAEVARGKEAAAANKLATADMNAWAKQVAAMDKENARQDAAQYAGQLGFDYDWMQSPVDKAEKKAAIAGYKQFFQQNPNTFVPDDTSGFSPEQKYIIASKLKQKVSTPMGIKAFQQKFNQDPRYFDLGRIQSDIVPTMGGWPAVRNWMFNNKANGGPIVDPMGQWAHPGQVTRIPSPNITMQGVPYPVLGVGSNGQQQMMYPGQEYSFGGAEHVDEYPMMQRGGAYVDSVLNANQNLDWVKRLYQKNGPSLQIPGQRGPSTHFMESGDGRVYPTVTMINNKLTYLPAAGIDPFDYADSTKTYIKFPTDKEATWFGKNYKLGTGVLPEHKNGGYVVTRSHDRKGKTHKVTGPDGTVKYFGDSHLGQHPKDPERKAAFYARHKHNLEHNPFFRAYARATWEDGGEIGEMAKGGEMIRRADGHYSHRGLWDNIRANAGSGKKPTKEMLDQERKIRKAQFGINMMPVTLPIVTSIANWWNKEPTEEEKKQAIIKAQQHAPYADNESTAMNIAEIFDPTGITSWDDWRRVHADPTTNWWDELVADVSVIPMVGKFGMIGKGATKGAKLLKGLTTFEKTIQAEKAMAEAAQVAKLAKEASLASKVRKGVSATADIVSGSRPMRWIDRTLNPAAQGWRALTNPIATRLPNYVMKPIQFANDFNASNRFLNGVGLGADYLSNKYYGNSSPEVSTGPYAIDPNKHVDSIAYNPNDNIPKGTLVKVVDERGRVTETHTNDPRLINLANSGLIDTIPATGFDQKNNAWKLKKGTKY